MINTANQTVLLPTLICEGGMKLNTKASKAPQNPNQAMIHIPTLLFRPIANGRFAFFIL